MKNLCEVMKLDPVPVRGEDIQKMVQGSKYRFDFATTPGVVKEVIDKIMTEYRQGKHLEKRPRILVTGCPIGGDSLKVIRAIEDNGGVVVAIENCSGVRTLGSPVEEDCGRDDTDRMSCNRGGVCLYQKICNRRETSAIYCH